MIVYADVWLNIKSKQRLIYRLIYKYYINTQGRVNLQQIISNSQLIKILIGIINKVKENSLQ